MAKRDPWARAKESMTQAASGLHRKDRERAAAMDRERVELSFLPLDDILPRPHGDARPLNPRHVEDLAFSIALLGLIQPVAVDRGGHLVAGGHRVAALQRLREEAPERYAFHFPDGLVPVRTLVTLDAVQDRQGARAAELEENEKRRDMTREELLGLAAELRTDGYRFVVGRPKGGEPGGLAPALSTASGKSIRTVRRWLAELREDAPPAASENGDNVTISSNIEPALRRLSSAIDATLQASGNLSAGPKLERLIQALERLQPLVNAAQAEQRSRQKK